MAKLDYRTQAYLLLGHALARLEKAMKQKPGPYPDPACPISKWQHAHEHLLAARELLK